MTMRSLAATTLVGCLCVALPQRPEGSTAPPHGFRGQTVERVNDTFVRVTQDLVAPGALTLPEYVERLTALQQERERRVGVGKPNQPGDEWEFVPTLMGGPNPATSAPITFSNKCFKRTTVRASYSMGTGVHPNATIVFDVQEPASLLCSDFYLITTVRNFHLATFELKGRHTIEWNNLGAVELQDVKTNGFRVFAFSINEVEVVESVWETVQLYLGALLGPTVPEDTARRNLKFLKDYSVGAIGEHFGEVRAITDVLPREADIKDGDLFCILRLDGLDPLINWGTGGNCGHNVVALRFGGVLHIVESQSKSNYWPKDFVQRNVFKDWIAMAKKADYNVLHLPLSAESRIKFDATQAATVFERDLEGLLYGFPNMLWGWFDTPSKNFPPPLSTQLVATLFAIVDPLLNPAGGGGTGVPSLWNGAMAQRLGLPKNTWEKFDTAALMGIASSRNMTFGDMLSMPENDTWTYPLPTTKCGRTAGCAGTAQVCNVFVCKIWKAGGLFDKDFDCGEQVPLDTMEMAIFQRDPPLSDACKKADPMNTQFCQILGKYRMALPHYNSVAPFDHMRAKCPSKAPNYAERFSPQVDLSC